jgi:hypothetical protein
LELIDGTDLAPRASEGLHDGRTGHQRLSA